MKSLFVILASVAALAGCAISGTTKPYVTEIKTPSTLSVDSAYAASAKAMNKVGTVKSSDRSVGSMNGVGPNNFPTYITVDRGAVTVKTILDTNTFALDSQMQKSHETVVEAVKVELGVK